MNPSTLPLAIRATATMVAAVLATSAAGAAAQVPPPGSALPLPNTWHDPLADLKARLQLRPAQEAAWSAWLAAMPPPHSAPPTPAATTPERLERMRAMRLEMDAEAQRRDAAVLSFYEMLDAGQRKIFDAAPPPLFVPPTGQHHGVVRCRLPPPNPE